MKRKCKNIDITNIEFIEKAITDCLSGKKKTRQDIASIMNKHNDSVHDKYSDSVLFCIKYNIHKYVKKARKVVSTYDKAKVRLQIA